MTNEDVERPISFLPGNQAKHDAQTAELRETVAGLGRAVAETNRAVQVMAAPQSEAHEMLTRAVADLTAAQRQLQAEQRKTQAQMRETQAQMRETLAQSRETDARLNALIGVVERLAGGA